MVTGHAKICWCSVVHEDPVLYNEAMLPFFACGDGKIIKEWPAMTSPGLYHFISQ